MNVSQKLVKNNCLNLNILLQIDFIPLYYPRLPWQRCRRRREYHAVVRIGYPYTAGIAKFLKLGPLQIVSSQKLHFGFILVFLSIAATLCAKASVLTFVINNNRSPDKFPQLCLVWMDWYLCLTSIDFCKYYAL